MNGLWERPIVLATPGGRKWNIKIFWWFHSINQSTFFVSIECRRAIWTKKVCLIEMMHTNGYILMNYSFQTKEYNGVVGAYLLLSVPRPWFWSGGRRPQFRLLANYIHKTVLTDTDRERYDWLLSMIKYWWVKK